MSGEDAFPHAGLIAPTRNDFLGRVIKRDARVAVYEARALESAALAEASTLDHVREKHGLAAARWLELAAKDRSAALALAAGPPS